MPTNDPRSEKGSRPQVFDRMGIRGMSYNFPADRFQARIAALAVDAEVLIIRPQIGIAFLTFACLLIACGGSKVLSKPETFAVEKPLAEVADENLAVILD
jgi:hypothetical protein